MAEFTLPANSVVKSGKTWPAPAGATRVKNFRIYRFESTLGYVPNRPRPVRADGAGRAVKDQK